MQAIGDFLYGCIYHGQADDKTAAQRFQENAGPRAQQYVTDPNRMGAVATRQDAQRRANPTRDNKPLSLYLQ